MGGEYYLDVVLAKSNAELFKELVRLYPLAELEDYYKGGMWQTDLMKMDIQVFFAHREEAGAPEPPPMEEVQLPPLPAGGNSISGLMMQARGISAMVPAGIVAAAGTSQSSTLQLAASLQAQLPAAELQLVVNFANKHKLDLVKSKTMLSQLTQVQRHAVMTGFAPTGGEESDTLKQLEALIAEKKRGMPATVPPTMPANGVAPVASLAAAAAKRPLTPTLTVPGTADPSKRPCLIMPQTGGVRPMVPGPVAPGALAGGAAMPPGARSIAPRPGMPVANLGIRTTG